MAFWTIIENGNVGCYHCGSAENNPYHYCSECKGDKPLVPTAKEHPAEGGHYRGWYPIPVKQDDERRMVK